MRSLPRCTTVGCSEKSILLFSPYFTTLSVVVRVCIRKPVNKGFSADFAKWNISDASVGADEHAESAGRGNYSRRTDLQLVFRQRLWPLPKFIIPTRFASCILRGQEI